MALWVRQRPNEWMNDDMEYRDNVYIRYYFISTDLHNTVRENRTQRKTTALSLPKVDPRLCIYFWPKLPGVLDRREITRAKWSFRFCPKNQHWSTRRAHLGDLYTESGQTLQCSFSDVSKPNFASQYSLESSRRDLHNALLCTALESIGEKWGKKGLAKTTPKRWKREAIKQLAARYLEPFSNLNFFVKNRQNFFAIELMNIH